jgi:CheY-like chemotaxis protein
MADGAIGRVLVVDDDIHIRHFLSQALVDEGYEAVTAADGIEAIAAIRRRRPDVILLDLMMPGMSGLAFLDIYRQSPPPHAPVIVITASRVTSLPPLPVPAEIVPKPFGVDDLLALIRQHLGHGPGHTPGRAPSSPGQFRPAGRRPRLDRPNRVA